MSPIVSLAFTAFGTFRTPANVPLVLCGFLFFIEVSSTLARRIILGIRLRANILGGHLFCELAEPLLGLLTVLLVYEVFIGTIQAFIFNSLVGLYFAEGDDHV
jgi:F0F1-type ATP synthase membrane subunit a